MATQQPEMAYKVCCDVFTSIGFETAHEAQAHLKVTHGTGCRLPHRVELTDRPYGTFRRESERES